MLKKLYYFLFFFGSAFCVAQNCPAILAPLSGAENIAVNTSISWEPVEGVPGYLISIGTSPGANDIENERAVGNATTYSPPLGLPENSPIYVTISLFFFDRAPIVCTEINFSTEAITTPPACATLTTPLDLSMNVNIGTFIEWDYVPGATEYSIRIGTTNGGEELVPITNLGNVLSYNPTSDFPENTTLFVQIIPANKNGTALNCLTSTFTTGSLASIPNCTSLSNNLNGAINVPLTPLIEWGAVPNATGYIVTIGASPFTSEVLQDATFFTNSTVVLNFEPNRTFYITITPFNDAGEALGCGQESFSTILGCGPYFDLETGELVQLAPVIDFPDTIGICADEGPKVVRTNDQAEGYRWYRIRGNAEELLSTTNEATLSDEGLYRYEAYNTATQESQTIECPSIKEFTVVSSRAPVIRALEVSEANMGININVRLEDNEGDFEYALNSSEGPYQDSNRFEDLENGSYTVFVRDKNGCGIAQESYSELASLRGFPSFFTPNGDLINDYWQFVADSNATDLQLQTIEIFDRFGNFITQISHDSIGWDGSYNGQPLPEADYWFRALFSEGQTVNGHFSLKN